MSAPHAPAVWAGPEATFVRIRGEVRDQLTATGHARRHRDLDLLAALGVSAVRQPVLWGWRARGTGGTDWRWADTRLARLRSLGMAPIVGLLHHGAGPGQQSLLDPDFPSAFAAYARRVAERYPWVEQWLPINEPTTTARFTSLYGWWEPHARSAQAFAASVVAQCRAIRAAVRAIRTVNPHARLVVNEDVGRTTSTPALRRQAAFDSERRWVALDLLTGRLRPFDPLWKYLAKCGQQAAVRELVDDPEPPDIVGLDYYVTSDRFLDERLGRYPRSLWGGNGRRAYVDVEAVRTATSGLEGWADRIAEAADRYRLPIALTEVALAGREVDRCAWFGEAWRAACRSRARGIDVVAVTAWSAFGAVGWDRLLADPAGTYEPGVFDVRTGRPAASRLARVIAFAGVHTPPPDQDARARSKRRHVPHRGWWRLPGRIRYPAA